MGAVLNKALNFPAPALAKPRNAGEPGFLIRALDANVAKFPEGLNVYLVLGLIRENLPEWSQGKEEDMEVCPRDQAGVRRHT